MLTLEQLYNLGNAYHIDIFSGITLPANSPINRTVLIDTILERCGMNYPMYADPNVMLSAINVWSARNQYTFEHVAKIINADYSPIENKYYSEETERDLADNTKVNNSRSEASNANSTVKEDRNSAHSGTDTTTDTTSAYNASDYQPDNRTDLQHGENIKDNATVNTTGASNKNINANSQNDKAVKEKIKSLQHGNIGVTSNFDLQSSEYSLLKDYNPYLFLCDLFERDLTLCVY